MWYLAFSSNGGLVLELRVESQGRTWIPRPAPLGLGRLACARGGVIRIYERAVRLMWPHWGRAVFEVEHVDADVVGGAFG